MKTPKIIHGGGDGPCLDCFHLALINANALAQNYISQEYYLKSKERALLEIPTELPFPMDLYDLLKVAEMLLFGLAKH